MRYKSKSENSVYKRELIFFLSDEPAEEDAFGSHQRIAEAILSIVCSSHGGESVNAIALEGAWGSGKSTVIKLLEKLFKEDACRDHEIGLFVYDSWAHQGDSLRRSFLERLINFLIEKGWINKSKWEQEKELLARRREESIVITEPHLTFWGNVLAVSLGFVPLGGVLVAIDKLKYGWILGILMAVSPFIAAFASWIIGKRKDSFSIFLQKTREIQTTTTIRTPDPTSVEFSEKFIELLREALSDKNRKRRLVIVIDNLDRLPPEEALSVWATMRTFFEVYNADSSDRKERLFLLVPYDPKALSRLWKKDSDSSDVATMEAFISKTFQVRFHVPQPVLSDWYNFMKDQLEKAFPEHKNEQELEIILRMYRLKGIPENRPLTPRDIKLFVNRLAAIHSQWGDEIPLILQAAYVLYEPELQGRVNVLSALGSDAFLSDEIKALIPEQWREEWQKYFAALYFNVPPKRLFMF